jgi:hypothetical protein
MGEMGKRRQIKVKNGYGAGQDLGFPRRYGFSKSQKCTIQKLRSRLYKSAYMIINIP